MRLIRPTLVTNLQALRIFLLLCSHLSVQGLVVFLSMIIGVKEITQERLHTYLALFLSKPCSDRCPRVGYGGVYFREKTNVWVAHDENVINEKTQHDLRYGIHLLDLASLLYYRRPQVIRIDSDRSFGRAQRETDPSAQKNKYISVQNQG